MKITFAELSNKLVLLILIFYFSLKGFVERAVQIYRECANIASVSKARVSLLKQDSKSERVELSIISKWSQRDLERNETRNFHRSHIASYDITGRSFCNFREPSFPMEVQNL